MKYLVLLLLVGCAPDLRYGDKVIVVEGFYNGQSGTVIYMTQGLTSYRCQVRFVNFGSEFVDCSDLKKE